MPVEPYIYLEGRAEEALNYYEKTLGAKRMVLMRYREAPDEGWKQMISAENANKVLHSAITIGGSTVMLSDGMCSGSRGKFEGFALTLISKDVAETERHFNALSERGKVLMPMNPTFFAHQFGMVADPFGVHWTLITPIEM